VFKTRKTGECYQLTDAILRGREACDFERQSQIACD
jgi:hypothetical protein